MIVKSATFMTSAVDSGRYPDQGLPEIAFAGRSNVGKSSLINCLVNRKNLVKTSSTPGKTRLINFFNINEQLVLVDLPGYGYARVSKQEQKKWGPMVETYLSSRKNLKAVILLLDARRLPREEEFTIIEWLFFYHIPCRIVLTKADKIKKNALFQQTRSIADALGVDVDSLLLFSSKSKLGRQALLDRIADLAGIPFDEDDDDKPISR